MSMYLEFLLPCHTAGRPAMPRTSFQPAGLSNRGIMARCIAAHQPFLLKCASATSQTRQDGHTAAIGLQQNLVGDVAAMSALETLN